MKSFCLQVHKLSMTSVFAGLLCATTIAPPAQTILRRRNQ